VPHVVAARADLGEEILPGAVHPAEELDAEPLHRRIENGGVFFRVVRIPVGVAHVRTRPSKTTPSAPKMTLGTQAARSGGMMPLLPIAFVSCTSMRKTTVIARLTPTPYAAPPRWVLVARGAAKIAMMMHVMGIA